MARSAAPTAPTSAPALPPARRRGGRCELVQEIADGPIHYHGDRQDVFQDVRRRLTAALRRSLPSRNHSTHPNMKKLLFQLDTDACPSTFDAVVAHDGGADHLISLAGVTPESCGPAVEGVIYTRGPAHKKNSARLRRGERPRGGRSAAGGGPPAFPRRGSASRSCSTATARTPPRRRPSPSCSPSMEKETTPPSRANRRWCSPGTGPVGQRIAGLLGRAGGRGTLELARAGRAKGRGGAGREAVRGAVRARRGERRDLARRRPRRQPHRGRDRGRRGAPPPRSGVARARCAGGAGRSGHHPAVRDRGPRALRRAARYDTASERTGPRHRLAEAAPAPGPLHRAALRAQRPGARRGGDLPPSPAPLVA